jgi:hypothetical protein
MSMPLVTIVAGLALAVLGVGTFVGTGSSHYTALIPAGLGAVYVLLGLLGSGASLRKHVMHGAAALSLLGLVAGVIMAAPRVPQLVQTGRYFRVVDGVQSDGTISTYALLTMTVICAIHLGLCVNSFIQARRKAREEAATKS